MIKINIDNEMGRILPAVVVKGLEADRIYLHELVTGRTIIYHEKIRNEPPIYYESPDNINTILATASGGEFVIFEPTTLNGVDISGEVSLVMLPAQRAQPETDNDTQYATRVVFESIRNENNRTIYRTDDDVETIVNSAQEILQGVVIPGVANITTGTLPAANNNRTVDLSGYTLTYENGTVEYSDATSAVVCRRDVRNNVVFGSANIAVFPWTNPLARNNYVAPGSIWVGTGGESGTIANNQVFANSTLNVSGSTGSISSCLVNGGANLNVSNTQGSVTQVVAVGSAGTLDLSNTATFGQWSDVLLEYCSISASGNSAIKKNIVIKNRLGVVMAASQSELNITVDHYNSTVISFVDASPSNIVTVDGIEALDLFSLIGPRITYVGEVWMFNVTNGDIIEGIKTASGGTAYNPPVDARIRFTNGSGVGEVLNVNDSGLNTAGTETLPFVNIARANATLTGIPGVGFGGEMLFERYNDGVLIMRENQVYG